MLADKKKNALTTLSFIAPGLILYTVLFAWQIVDGFRLSFFKWTSITTKVFAGFRNYQWIIHDGNFYRSLNLTLTYTVAIMVGSIILGFTFGYLIYLGLKGKNFFRVVYFIPTVLSGVAVSYIWKYLFSPSIGVTKGLMEALGYGANTSPLGLKETAFSAAIFVALWSSLGIQVMMFNAAFNNIPDEVIESASLDGCKGISLVWHFIIPLSWDVVKMVIILQMIGALRAFDQIFVMTGGGPFRSTEILPMYMYLTAFENLKFGEGNTIAVAIFILSMILTVIMRRIMKRESVY